MKYKIRINLLLFVSFVFYTSLSVCQDELPKLSLSQKEMARDIVLPDYCENMYPEQRLLDVTETVIDTLKADSMYNEIRQVLLEEYNKGVRKLQKVQQLISMRGKKVTDISDLQFLQYAYINAITYHSQLKKYKTKNPNDVAYIVPTADPIINNGRDGQSYKTFEKNVKKGKITENVVTYLELYNTYLTDSLKQVEDSINSGWFGNIAFEDLPRKKIIKQMNNPYYRGLWYNNCDKLDLIERYQQAYGWEFLYSENRISKEDSYPSQVRYYVYDSAPQYKVTYSDSEINNVYNSNGELVFVPRLTRKNYDEFDEIQRLVFLQDYRKNKYNIKSKSVHTQNYLRLLLEREHGFEKSFGEEKDQMLGKLFCLEMFGPIGLLAMQQESKNSNSRGDKDGRNYIEQLRKDHENEFGYVYMITRLSNTSFQILYINRNSLSPSYSAVITYRTGKRPFTSDFSAKLVPIPSAITPILKSM